MQIRKEANGGIAVFSELIESNCYYVDKTRFLRPVFTRRERALLFTRPRRFGKTLTMSMFKSFLEIDPRRPGHTDVQQRLFKGLDVLEDHDFCQKFMGQFPVVYISLKDVCAESFDKAMIKLARAEAEASAQLGFLATSDKLDADDKATYYKLSHESELEKGENWGCLSGFLGKLSGLLAKHFGRKAIVLVDEYDVPLAKAFEGDYYDSMVKFYNDFMYVLKESGSADQIFKIVMTGCLKVAKASIFTGTNNFTPNTVLSMGTPFSAMFGFTPDETKRYLDAFGLSDHARTVRENYDGYRFGNEEIYNPWDVCKYVVAALDWKESGTSGNMPAGNYWVNTESQGTLAIKRYVAVLVREGNQSVQDLSDGKDTKVAIHDNMRYDTLNGENAGDFWALLLHTGYLTALQSAGENGYVVRIPNLEIKQCYDDSIKAAFYDELAKNGGVSAFTSALLEGDRDAIEATFQELLLIYVSQRHAAAKASPEIAYEFFVLGVLANLGKGIANVKSEAEAGRGFADIMLTSPTGDIGVVIELKVSKSTGSFKTDVEAALDQIQNRQYAVAFMNNSFVKDVYAVGLACCRKSCSVGLKVLKGGHARQKRLALKGK